MDYGLWIYLSIDLSIYLSIYLLITATAPPSGRKPHFPHGSGTIGRQKPHHYSSNVAMVVVVSHICVCVHV